MTALAVYDSDNFAADQIELSLSQAGEKYSDWQQHQDGHLRLRSYDPCDCDARISLHQKRCCARNINVGG